MAKKKNSVNVDVNVKGKGTKKTSLEMKNLGKETDKTSKSTGELNRNWKGASKQSSGASKNFSKMSQGMGGIVGAYATLAANIFALSAAFRFLESAGNLEKLKQGQEIYASSTGVALRSLTNDIIAATDAQVTFENASQSAAIGKAAGLTNDQLTKLGKGAKDVSIILGRDVTDSFNRLVRGVTKAEPELLDELGIILRLNDATEAYAATIGKSANDLTQFEKSQAVTVDVLDQLESKYGRLMAVVEPSGNSFTKLGKAFDDIVNQIKEVALVVAGPIAEVLTRVPQLALGIMAAFANTLIKASMASWADRAAASAENLATKYGKAEKRLAALQRLRRMKTGGQQVGSVDARAADKALGGITSKGKVAGPAFDKLRAGEKLNKAEIQAARRVVQRRKGLDEDMKRSYLAALKKMEAGTKVTAKQMQIEFSLATSKIAIAARKAQLVWTSALGMIQRAAAFTGRVLTMAMSAVSWISIIATLGTVIYQFFKVEEAVDETAQELDAAGQKVADLNQEFSKFNEMQKIIVEDGQGFLQFFQAMGERIGSLSLNMQKTLIENAEEGFKTVTTRTLTNKIREMNELTQQFTEGLGPDGQEFFSFKALTDQIDVINQTINGIETAGFSTEVLKYASPGDMAMTNVPTTFAPGTRQAQEEIQRLTDDLGLLDEAYKEILPSQQAMAGDLISFLKMQTDNKGLQELGQYYENQLGALELQTEAFPDAKNAVTDYLHTLQKLRSIDFKTLGEEGFQALVEEIGNAQSAAMEYGATVSSVLRAQKENAQESAKLITDAQGLTQGARMISMLEEELKLRAEVANLEAGEEDSLFGMSDEERSGWDDRGKAIDAELKLFKIIEERRDAMAQRVLEQSLAEQQALIGTTKLVAKRIKLEQSILKNRNKIQTLDDEAAEIAEKAVHNGGVLEDHQKRRLIQLGLERQILEAQNAAVERKLDLNAQIFDAANQSLETGLEKTLSAFIKGKESSFKDAMLGLAESVLGSVADTLAKQLTDFIMDTSPLSALTQGGQIVHDKIVEAFQSVNIGGTTGPEDPITAEELFGPARVAGVMQAQAEENAPLTGVGTGERPIEEIVAVGKEGPFAKLFQSFSALFQPGTPWMEKLGTFFGSGENSFLKGLGGVFGGLGDIFSNLLGGAGSILGNIPGLGFLGMADGGIAKGGFRKYAGGGIATSPTVGLIGEGKHNEAVVPLPNGKAIPVDMRSSAQNNNVTVNVSTDGRTQTEGQDNEGLGRAVARAVQEELQNQKRAGGILNRYGTA